jgi:hypothetical protein
MGQLSFTTSLGKNEGLVISPSSLLEQYFHGISITTKDGRSVPESTIKQKILAAQEMVSNALNVKLTKQIHTEDRDFIKDEYHNWGYMQVTYPVRDVLEMTGYINTTKQTEFPLTWTSQMGSSDVKNLKRTIHIVPAGSTTPQVNSVVYLGIAPNLGYWGLGRVPNYWHIKYCTGFDEIPADVLQLIGKIASIQLFAITGDIVLGSGIAGQSLSYDGLSQSIETTQSAENSAHSARIRQYQGELKTEMPALKDYYNGIKFMVV